MFRTLKTTYRWTICLSEQERADLREALHHSSEPYVRERCAAILKVGEGHTPHWVAAHGLLRSRQPDTIYQWMRWYQQDGWQACWPIALVALAGGVFDRAQEVRARLQQGPAAAVVARQPDDASGPSPSRWSLRRIQAAFPWLAGYSLAGVWKLLHGYGFKLRSGHVQAYSPDPDYLSKQQRLVTVLREAAAAPGKIEVVFLDEMDYGRWPEAAADWVAQAPAPAPVAGRKGNNERKWRLIGALNALTGQVTYLDNYIVGRKQVIKLLKQLDAAYPQAERICVVLDNWSIHQHAEVQAALSLLPRVQVVWLPTYAPWLNPIEKLWRWFRQDLWYLHQQADDWSALQARVHQFFDQFASGSQELLRYVGLLGEGQLAQALRAS
jgi:transposase